MILTDVIHDIYYDTQNNLNNVNNTRSYTHIAFILVFHEWLQQTFIHCLKPRKKKYYIYFTTYFVEFSWSTKP